MIMAKYDDIAKFQSNVRTRPNSYALISFTLKSEFGKFEDKVGTFG